jgi:hypothetical protein
MARRTGVSLAQSGGRNTTFGGGKGGTKLSRGVTADKKIGSGTQNGVNRYTIRATGGNDTPAKGKRKRAGAPPPVHAGGAGMATAIVRPKQLPPVLRGSTNATKGKYR